MNRDIFEGKWNEYKGKVKEKWGKLTEDELTQINGKRENLLGKLQARYGWSREAAHKELETFEDALRKTVNSDSAKINKREEFPSQERHNEHKDMIEKKRKVQ